MSTKTPIYIISGPSGAGEDSVLEIIDKDLGANRVITTVTRNMRPHEKQGQPYYFVDRLTFEKMLANDEFIEWAEVYGDLRGCTKQEISRLQALDRPILWKVDWQGVRSLKKIFPKAVAIFIMPPDYETLERRLVKRDTDDPEVIKKRADFSRDWLNHQEVYDHVVINADGALDQTIAQVKAIIQSDLDKTA